MSRDFTTDRADVERQLRERAEHLARPLFEERFEAQIEVLHLELSGERYALEAAFVRNIVRHPRVFAVPGTPAHFAGVAALHGESPIVNLRPLLGLAAPGADEPYVVFLGRERVEFGILVDDVLAIDLIDPQAVQPAAARGEHSFVRGMLPDAEVVLDGAALLDDPRFIVESNLLPVSQGAER